MSSSFELCAYLVNLKLCFNYTPKLISLRFSTSARNHRHKLELGKYLRTLLGLIRIACAPNSKQ